MEPDRTSGYMWNGGWMNWRHRNNEFLCEPEYPSFKDIPVYLSEEKPVSQEIPIVNMEYDRRQSIIENTPAFFEIKENKNADGSEPLIELSAFNPVGDGALYDEMANKYGVNPDWLKAIAYMESTHGYYDGLPIVNKLNTSYRPMNIKYEAWKPLAEQLGFSESEVKEQTKSNVEMGALIIKRITTRVPNATLEKVASIYNFTGAEITTDYGARVKAISEGRLWEK